MIKKLFKFKTLFGFLCIFIFSWFLKAGEECYQRYSAYFDIGSGSTKGALYKVLSCPEKLTYSLVKEDSIKVDYKNDLLLATSPNQFSLKIRNEGISALLLLKKKLTKDLNEPIEYKAIATAAFREATNASKFAKEIKSKTQIPVEIISQEKEAQLAWRAIQNKLKQNNTLDSSFLAWDIGGGSFQIIYRQDNKFNTIQGHLASVSFKNKIINQIKNKPDSTPNPLTEKEVLASRNIVKEYFQANHSNQILPASLTKLAYGIGGVLSKSIQQSLSKDRFVKSDIDSWIKKNHKKNDSDFNSPFASTIITNMILVSELMELFKIKEIQALDVPLVEGLFE